MPLDTHYDRINTALFLTVGGSRKVRAELVDALGVQGGSKVLELGCGTGQVTALLVEHGAEVLVLAAVRAGRSG